MRTPPPANAALPRPEAWASFADRSLERRYRAVHLTDDQSNARLLVALAVTANLAFGLSDLQQPAGVTLLLVLRCGVVASGLALYAWLRRPRPALAFDRLLFAWGLAAATWQAVVQVYRPPGHLGPTTATLCSTVLIYTILPLPLWRLTAVAVTQLAGCLTVAAWVNPVPDLVALRALVVWGIGLNLIGWATARRLQTRSRQLFVAAERQADLTASLEKALAEVKTLRGLFRICAWCKGVHADGEWQQLERYVAAHSHAEFSHGICPTCVAGQLTPAAPASRGSSR